MSTYLLWPKSISIVSTFNSLFPLGQFGLNHIDFDHFDHLGFNHDNLKYLMLTMKNNLPWKFVFYFSIKSWFLRGQQIIIFLDMRAI